MDSFLDNEERGREYLVVSQAAWSCQRAVIFDDYILIKTYMDGLKDFPELMLFNRIEDPHETDNLAERMPEIVSKGLAKLDRWYDDQMKTADIKEDPMMKIIEEGGPYHTKGELNGYLEHYRGIGRGDIADRMEEKYKDIAGYTMPQIQRLGKAEENALEYMFKAF